MKKAALTLVAGLLIGIALGRWMAGNQRPPTRDTAAEHLLAQAAQDISSAPDAETRQKRIEELLQKIFKLFMIDVSLRLQALEKASEPSTPAAPAVTSSAPPPAVSVAGSAVSQEPSPARLQALEKFLVATDDQEKMESALEQLAQQDFTKSYSKTTAPSALQSEPLLGVFEGKIELFDGRAPWSLRVSVSTSNRAERQNPNYSYEIHVTKAPGKVSRSNGRGGLKGFSVSSENPQMYFIEAGDDVLQLYLSQKFNGLTGLLYEGPNKFSMKATGRVLLHKTRQN